MESKRRRLRGLKDDDEDDCGLPAVAGHALSTIVSRSASKALRGCILRHASTTTSGALLLAHPRNASTIASLL